MRPEGSLDSTPPGLAARGSLLNGAGLLLPLLVAVLLLPLLARLLGPPRFGLFVLTWTLLDYLALADLGFARTGGRFVATDLARGRVRAVRQSIALTTAAQLVLGFTATFALLSLAEPIATILLRATGELRQEAIALVRTAAFHVPVLLVMSGLRAALEGAQRFGVSAALRAPVGAAAIVAAVIAAGAGVSLAAVMFVVLAVRILGLIAHVAAVSRAVPGFAWERPRRWARLRRLLDFGGWVALSTVISPVLLYAERFVLAAIGGPAAAGRYVLPHEALHRLLVIPGAIVVTILPLLSGLEASGRTVEARRLAMSAARHTLALLAPPLLGIAVFAPALLALWLGAPADDLVLAVRILAAGVLVNALMHVPSASLLAANRPDLPARAHVVELVVYLPLLVWLVLRFGLPGAAAAWTLRVIADGLILVIACRGALGAVVGPGAAERHTLVLVLSLAAGLIAVSMTPGHVVPLLAAAVFAAYAVLAWSLALTTDERATARRLWAGRERTTRPAHR